MAVHREEACLTYSLVSCEASLFLNYQISLTFFFYFEALQARKVKTTALKCPFINKLFRAIAAAHKVDTC